MKWVSDITVHRSCWRETAQTERAARRNENQQRTDMDEHGFKPQRRGNAGSKHFSFRGRTPSWALLPAIMCGGGLLQSAIMVI